MWEIYLNISLYRAIREDIAIYCGEFNTRDPNSFFVYIPVGSVKHIKLVLSLNAHTNVFWYPISVRAHSRDNPRTIMATWSSRKLSYVPYNESINLGTSWFLSYKTKRQKRQKTIFRTREALEACIKFLDDDANEKHISNLKILPQLKWQRIISWKMKIFASTINSSTCFKRYAMLLIFSISFQSQIHGNCNKIIELSDHNSWTIH